MDKKNWTPYGHLKDESKNDIRSKLKEFKTVSADTESQLVFLTPEKGGAMVDGKLYTTGKNAYITFKSGNKERTGLITHINTKPDSAGRYQISYARNKGFRRGAIFDTYVSLAKDITNEQEKKIVKGIEKQAFKVEKLSDSEIKERKEKSRSLWKQVALSAAISASLSLIISLACYHPVPTNDNTPNITIEQPSDQEQGPSVEDVKVNRVDLNEEDKQLLNEKIAQVLAESGKDVSAGVELQEMCYTPENTETNIDENKITIHLANYTMHVTCGDRLYEITSSGGDFQDVETFVESDMQNAAVAKEYQTVGGFVENNDYYNTFKDALSKKSGEKVKDVYVIVEKDGMKESFRKSHEGDTNYRYDADLLVVDGAGYQNAKTYTYSTTAKNTKAILDTIMSEVNNNVMNEAKLDDAKNFTAQGFGTVNHEASAEHNA